MTISAAEDGLKQYPLDGSADPELAYTITFKDHTDVEVWLVPADSSGPVELVLNTDYSIAGDTLAGAGVFTITRAVANGDVAFVDRNTAARSTLPFSNLVKLNDQAVENQFDDLARQIGDLKRRYFGGAISAPYDVNIIDGQVKRFTNAADAQDLHDLVTKAQLDGLAILAVEGFQYRQGYSALNTYSGNGLTGDLVRSLVNNNVYLAKEAGITAFEPSANPDKFVLFLQSLDGGDGADGKDAISGSGTVRLVQKTNIDISTALHAGETIDGETLAADDKVLLPGQTAGEENGPYVVQSAGAAVREPAFEEYDDVSGILFTVQEGSEGNADSLWLCTSDKGGEFDTDDLTFTQFDFGILRSNADANLDAGFTSTQVDDGEKTAGTYTPDPAGGNFKTIENGGAFLLAGPTAVNNYSLIIHITNNSGAGAITLSGFDKSSGDDFTTTDTHEFFLYITKLNGKKTSFTEALQ